jgi:two-component system chemotaxis sensor kinase CheA
MDELEKELKEDFLVEAQQLLEDIEQAFLRLENEPNNEDLLNEIFRFAHNLKGTSRAVGFGDMAEFTHEVENLILKLKNGEIQISDHIISLLLDCNDHIDVIVKMLNMDLNSRVDSSELISKIQQVLSGEAQQETAPPVEQPVNEETQEVPDADSLFFDDTNETPLEPVEQEQAEVAKPQEDINIKVGTTPVNEWNPDNVQKKKPQKTEVKAVNKDESIRVSLERVEKLNNYVGELVILKSVLREQGKAHSHDELMNKSIQQLEKLSKEIQDISMSLRMVPLKSTLAKMGRIVRDTSGTLGKKVELHLSGEETEIDKTVLEHLSDPLVHIVRNAVDHGLESNQERAQKGKDEIGHVHINAFHEGNNLVVEVSDDGSGIDPEVIRSKAIEKGVIGPNSNLDDFEIINLIFHPGFSTKEQVTEVSGRGVGMDVVKTNIELLSGQVSVTSEKEKGSVFRIQLPLTLAIIEAMVVNVSSQRFVIPFAQVTEFLNASDVDTHFIPGVGECIDLRGEVIPIVYIQDCLKLKHSEQDNKRKTAIIFSSNKRKCAVLVDDIVSQQQVVVKKLGLEIKDQVGYMGSAILGDGKASIIIDLAELFKDHKKTSRKPQEVLQRAA